MKRLHIVGTTGAVFAGKVIDVERDREKLLKVGGLSTVGQRISSD